MLTQRNEYYENARMIEAFEGDDRTLFNEAVRRYAAGTDFQRARLVEAVIRTSRLVDDDSRVLPDDIRHTLGVIQNRYRSFACSSEAINANTYLDARKIMKALFF